MPPAERSPRLSRRVATVVRRGIEVSALLVFLVVLWQVYVWVFDPKPFLVPSPGAVASAAFDPELRWPGNILTTTVEALGGFAIAATAGILFGIIIAWSPVLSRTLVPALVAFNTVPKVAVAPLFIVYLGFGIFPTMILAATVAFFPIVINAAMGLSQIDSELVDLAASLKAPKWMVFWRVRIPGSIPHIFSGLKIAVSLAVVGAIVGEFVASQSGLGNLIMSTQVNLRTDIAFASIFWLTVVSLTLYAVVALAARFFAPWAASDNEDNTK